MGAKEQLKLKEQEVLDLQEQVRTLTSKAAEYEQLYKEELNKNSCYEAEDEHKYESFLKLNDKYLKRYIADNSDLLKEKVKEVIKEVSIGVPFCLLMRLLVRVRGSVICIRLFAPRL